MTSQRLSPKKRSRVIEDSEDEEIESRRSSPAKRTKDAQKAAWPRSRILTPTTSEDEAAQGIFIRGPWNPLSHVEIPPITCPKSSYAGSSSSVDEFSEEDALQDLLQSWKRHQKSTVRIADSDAEDYIEFHVEEFAVYREIVKHYLGRNRPPVVEHELCTLETLRSKRGLDTLLLDAVLSFRGMRRYVRHVPFDTVSIEGYDSLDIASVTGVFLQTKWCKKRRIWLRLGKPSREYARYHDDFLWCADFGKHVVDYMSRAELVSLSHFRARFFNWATEEHGSNPQFLDWAGKSRSTDFRTAFNRYFQWLWSEATNEWIDPKQAIRSHPIWKEADPDGKWLTAIPKQESALSKTIVTPYVYHCFKKMYFGGQLEAEGISDPKVQAAYDARKQALGFAMEREDNFQQYSPSSTQPSQAIKVGDIIGVTRDLETDWQSKSTIWYLYVSKIQRDVKGPYYQGMWLYAPDDTTMAKMKYPHQNELFLSDNCNCDQKLIRPDDVTAQTEITWSPRKIPLISYFVRQTFNTSDQSFRTLQTDDFSCSCQKPTVDTFTEMRQRFSLFDTVLVKARRRGLEILEPCIIEQFDAERELIQVRRLQRAKRDFDCAEARPHELVWTSKFVDIKPEHILRKCKIRMLLNCASPRCSHKACPVPKKVPSIYDRDGQADCFLITKCLEAFGGKEIAVDLMHDQILRFTQGEDFDSNDRKKLAAMSLFSGGGNFDRGFEEAGAMRSKWAVEWNANAAHTYRANLRRPDDTAIFLGSIDEHLHRALAGRLSTTVPAIGQVEVLLAGSPCQGFSALQQHRMSLHSMANASKVATVAAYIDLWRPLYAVLENVPEMTRQLGPDKQENVFAQLLCCLVGMGYQVQQLLMDAWSYGEAQSRPRLFIIATAPGLPLLEHPNMTHAHPKDMPAKSLGKAPNKQPYGVRYADTPTYPFITARDATGDLPNIGDGHTHGCLALPDHRPGAIMSPLEQRLICRIPKLPRGQGLVDVFAQREPLPRLLHDWIERQSELRLSSNSKSFQRLDPTKLFRTITTKLTPTDGIAGFGVHWDQDRVLTVMEARRAQGFLDHEVIIGDVTVQWKIIGNSVSRAVALALGMSLRQAWLSITGSSGHAAVGRPPRPGNPLVIIAHPQERVSKAPSTPSVHCSLGPQLRVEAETHAPVHLSMQDTNGRLQTLISTNSRGKHETAFPQPHDLQVSSPVTIRGSPPAVLEEHHSRSALTIRLGQTTARQLPKLETTTIIELDDSGNVINGGHSGSEVPSPKTPGFTIHQDTTAFGYSVQSTASDFGITSENLRYDKNHLKTEMMSANPSNREGRSKEQEVHEIDDGDDDDVVFISSRIVSK